MNPHDKKMLESFNEWLEEQPAITDCLNKWDIRALKDFLIWNNKKQRDGLVSEIEGIAEKTINRQHKDELHCGCLEYAFAILKDKLLK